MEKKVHLTQGLSVPLPVPAGLLQVALFSREEMKSDRPCKRPFSIYSF